MAQSILGLFRDLEEHVIGPTRRKINVKVFEILLRSYKRSEMTQKELIEQISNITFKLRNKREYDKAASLELLVEIFMGKAYIAKPDFEAASFREHFSVLKLLILLENAETGRSLSDASYKTLNLLHIHNGDLNLQAPKDIFSYQTYDIFTSSVQSQVPNLKLFSHDKGALIPDEMYVNDTRFARSNKGYTMIDFESFKALGLGDTMIKPIDNNNWFVDRPDSLLGAFQHLQTAQNENPFGIHLEIPSLAKESVYAQSFPFPAIKRTETERDKKSNQRHKQNND